MDKKKAKKKSKKTKKEHKKKGTGDKRGLELDDEATRKKVRKEHAMSMVHSLVEKSFVVSIVEHFDDVCFIRHPLLDFSLCVQHEHFCDIAFYSKFLTISSAC